MIRAERPDDIPAIAEVNRLAFGQENEATLVEAIRRSAGFIPALSLVAELDGVIVGHVLLSRIAIVTATHTHTARGTDAGQGQVPALALAPVAVRPADQRRGIGSALIVEGLARARQLGERIVVLIGHPAYYPRFGFRPARQHGLEAPFPISDEVFMALALVPGALDGIHGTVVYPPAFDAV